jgi:hypothetical protein
MNVEERKADGNIALKLRAGELVEVKTKEEILATLDDQGTLDRLPFMPEMLEFCGKRFKVFKRAHKTCDTIEYTGSRWMKNAVHLEGTRCTGSDHGGCQAACLLFWKEAWLRRVKTWPEDLVAQEKDQSPDSWIPSSRAESAI